jgi:hypothetical protein
VTYHVLFFIHLESHRADIASITVHPDDDQGAMRCAIFSLRSVTLPAADQLR